MNMPNFFDLSSKEFETEDLPQNQRTLHTLLVAAVNYIPLMLAFNAVGFFIIYLLAYLGLLDAPDLKLLGVAAISLITALLHIPIANLLKKNRINAVISWTC
jgi:hypothetical protein